MSDEKTGQGIPISEEQWCTFLAALAECGSVTKSAEAAGFARLSAYRRRKDDPEFAAAWDEARLIGGEGLEDEARRRAFDGWDEPKYHQGVVVGAIRKYSDTLLIFLLKGIFPEKYRNRVSTEHSGSIDTGDGGLDLSTLSTDELRTVRRLVDKARKSVEEE